jgi:hypothetical protein
MTAIGADSARDLARDSKPLNVPFLVSGKSRQFSRWNM